MADSAGTGQQNVRMPVDLTVANASKARPEVPCSWMEVARLDGRKAVRLQAWKLKSGFHREAALILK